MVSAPSGSLPLPGTRVRRGDLLALLVPTPSSPELTTRDSAEVSRAAAEVEAATLALARARALVAEGAIAERRVTDAERERRVAEDLLAAARRTSAFAGGARRGRGGAGWRIVSPIDGVVDDVFVVDGASVGIHEPLFRVVGEETRWVTVSVPEGWLGELPDRPWGSFRLLGEPGARALDAESLVHVGRVVDPRTRTIAVRFRVPAERALRVGAAATAQLSVGMPRAGLVVPREAVLDLDGRRVSIVRVAEDELLERDVQVALVAGDEALITEGLDATDELVVASRSGSTTTWYSFSAPPIALTIATPGTASRRLRTSRSAMRRSWISSTSSRSARSAMNAISPTRLEGGTTSGGIASGGSATPRRRSITR